MNIRRPVKTETGQRLLSGEDYVASFWREPEVLAGKEMVMLYTEQLKKWWDDLDVIHESLPYEGKNEVVEAANAIDFGLRDKIGRAHV